MRLDGMIDQTDLERILRANPWLTYFILAYDHSALASHPSAKHIVEATLDLRRLVHLLPKLQTINLVAPASLRLDYNLQAASGDILSSHLDKIDIDGCSVSLAVLIWLVLLPKLREVSFENVVLIDPKSALKLIKRILNKPIQSHSHLLVRLAFPTVILSEECSQVLVEWVAAMPTLLCV
ncbi:hypothetical protein GQ42DRAFT_52214 [Ramicandelaber brevisporus]|nr:hypothetical protein GQ42DRAFT_52214 [Ramicandelaber brevisporus]